MSARFGCLLCPDHTFDVITDIEDHRDAVHPRTPLSAVYYVRFDRDAPPAFYEAHCGGCAALVVRTTPFPNNVVRCADCEAKR